MITLVGTQIGTFFSSQIFVDTIFGTKVFGTKISLAMIYQDLTDMQFTPERSHQSKTSVIFRQALFLTPNVTTKNPL